VLNFCSHRLPGNPKFNHKAPCFIHPKPDSPQTAAKASWTLMAGRLGADVNTFFNQADPADLIPIEPIPELWAELAWAARNEAVVHLDDLLLRRVRLGILFPRGGMDLIDQVRARVQPLMGWSDETWAAEVRRYEQIWHENYYLPG
jgi:glycerol-3-phosphate dehydrogenase